MNKIKTYREYIILAVIAAVLLLYIIFRSAGNINYDLPVVEKADSDSITRISIIGPNIGLDFNKTEDAWLLNPEGWYADKGTLNTIVSALADLKLTDLISSSGNPEIYNLDEAHRIKVTAYTGDTVLREIFVGKVTSSGIYTYISFPGDDNIYSIRGDLPSRFSGDKNSMRDKAVLTVPRNETQRLTLTSSGDDVIVLAEDDEGIWSSSNGEDTDKENISSAIASLSPLRCKEFISSVPDGKAEWIIETRSSEGIDFLEIWPETDTGYPARSSQNGYPVLISSYAVENILKAFGIVFE